MSIVLTTVRVFEGHSFIARVLECDIWYFWHTQSVYMCRCCY